AGSSPHFEHEFRMRHKNGAFRWVLARGLAVRDGQGRAVRFAGSQNDITEGKVVDALTGLPNRMWLPDRVGRLIDHQCRYGGPGFAVLFLDIDGFKVVNDSVGHVVGDELLQSLARRLEGSLRLTDTVMRIGDADAAPALTDHTLARVGGDEFVVLLSA